MLLFIYKWIHLVSSQVNITVDPAFLRVPQLWIQPTSKYYQKNLETSKKQNLNFHALASFCIAFTLY